MSDLKSSCQDVPVDTGIRMGVWFRVEWDLARSAASTTTPPDRSRAIEDSMWPLLPNERTRLDHAMIQDP